MILEKKAVLDLVIKAMEREQIKADRDPTKYAILSALGYLVEKA